MREIRITVTEEEATAKERSGRTWPEVLRAGLRTVSVPCPDCGRKLDGRD